MTGIYYIASVIEKLILELALLFSLRSTDKTQCFVHLSFDSTLQLINGISSDVQEILKYFNGIAIVEGFHSYYLVQIVQQWAPII